MFDDVSFTGIDFSNIIIVVFPPVGLPSFKHRFIPHFSDSIKKTKRNENLKAGLYTPRTVLRN